MGILKILVKGTNGEAYNVSYESSVVTITDVARIVADIAGVEVVVDLPDAVEDFGYSKPQNCVLKNDKLSSLGWQGQYSLNNGLKETINILKS